MLPLLFVVVVLLALKFEPFFLCEQYLGWTQCGMVGEDGCIRFVVVMELKMRIGFCVYVLNWFCHNLFS